MTQPRGLRVRRPVALAARVALCLGLAGGAAGAAGSPGRGRDPKVAPATMAKLASADPGDLAAALDDVRLEGVKDRGAAPAIAALLKSGLPYPLAVAAIETLADVEWPDGAAAIAPYAHHRDLKVRRAAVKGLAKSVGPAGLAVAATELRAALADPDPQVRGVAATGLGSLKAKVAVLDLFLALDHHVFEAAVSIGQLCDVSECDALVGRMGKIPFDVVTTGLDQILFRPSAEVSDDEKIGIIHRVRDLGTRDANRFLRAVQGRWPAASRKVRKELDDAVMATAASPGGER